ncbi:hypothetical protein P9B03_02065 [Metasolibacillus meyeri]|uniref:Mobilization protein n=1 Tax=Metasolibacillus meyeri TaxID=1071052 RepID=A0AAW9NR84_9BACL|nr:hypothetical protein [Metasolibacillus meyeri]MEC1177256.1 hypothetical protein [Metasolibacillus meyeri]
MAGQDIFVRKLDHMIVAKLNQNAKKKGMSREAYLRLLLTNSMMMDTQANLERPYEELLMWNARLLKEVTNGQESLTMRMMQLERVIQELIRLERGQ